MHLLCAHKVRFIHCESVVPRSAIVGQRIGTLGVTSKHLGGSSAWKPRLAPPDMMDLEPVLMSAGQDHLWRHYIELHDDHQRDVFASELASIDWAELAKSFRKTMEAAVQQDRTGNDDLILPLEDVQTIQGTRPKDASKWRQMGLRAIAEGRVGALLLAGGQGTRLGSDAPKGCYDIGLPSHKSLFQLHAERLLALERLAAAELGNEGSRSIAQPIGRDRGERSRLTTRTATTTACPIRWWIMTSEATDAETRAFFQEHGFFGLQPAQVTFIRQGVLPALDTDGRAILASPGHLALSPNGNGGVYASLRSSGALAEMAETGIEALDCWPVDNAVAAPLSPEWIGRCLDQRADVGCRVLARAGPQEKVGVFARVRTAPDQPPRLGVVEYSELSPERAERVDSSTGRLAFNWANTCLHFFSRDWLERVTGIDEVQEVSPGISSPHQHEQPPPYHIARKTIPAIDGPVPGIKLELFIFDPFYLAETPCMVEVERHREFAPVKSAPGSGADCPETARSLVVALHRSWVEAAGGVVESTEGVEVSPLVSLDGEGLEARCHGICFSKAYDARLQTP